LRDRDVVIRAESAPGMSGQASSTWSAARNNC